MKKKNTPHIIPVPYNKPIEICADQETLLLLQRFQALRAANYELTQTWCIVPESENPICWNPLELPHGVPQPSDGRTDHQ